MLPYQLFIFYWSIFRGSLEKFIVKKDRVHEILAVGWKGLTIQFICNLLNWPSTVRTFANCSPERIIPIAADFYGDGQSLYVPSSERMIISILRPCSLRFSFHYSDTVSSLYDVWWLELGGAAAGVSHEEKATERKIYRALLFSISDPRESQYPSDIMFHFSFLIQQ